MKRPYLRYTVVKTRHPETEWARQHPWQVFRPHPVGAGDLVGSFPTQRAAFRFAHRAARDAAQRLLVES